MRKYAPAILFLIISYITIAFNVFMWRNPKANYVQPIRFISESMTFKKLVHFQ